VCVCVCDLLLLLVIRDRSFFLGFLQQITDIF